MASAIAHALSVLTLHLTDKDESYVVVSHAAKKKKNHAHDRTIDYIASRPILKTLKLEDPFTSLKKKKKKTELFSVFFFLTFLLSSSFWTSRGHS